MLAAVLCCHGVYGHRDGLSRGRKPRLFYMRIITALTPQKRNENRVNVFLDGEFAFGLPTAVSGKLTVGQALTPTQIAALQQEDVLDKAYNSAVRFLTYRPRSVAEVRQNLQKKEYDPAIIEAVIEKLEGYGFLNDVAFAEYWLEQRETFKPRGRMALQQELRQKGVEPKIIDQVLKELNEDDAALQAATRKARSLSQLPKELFQQKLGQFLQRRGFHYETIRHATEEAWRQLNEDN